MFIYLRNSTVINIILHSCPWQTMFTTLVPKLWYYVNLGTRDVNIVCDGHKCNILYISNLTASQMSSCSSSSSVTGSNVILSQCLDFWTPFEGERFSSVVRAFAHGAMGRGSILNGVDSLTYFSFQTVLHDWCNKGHGMCDPVCAMVHIKESPCY